MIDDLIFLILPEYRKGVGKDCRAARVRRSRPLEADARASSCPSHLRDRGRRDWETSCSDGEGLALRTFVWIKGSDNKRVVTVGVEASHSVFGYLGPSCTVPGQGG